MSAVTIPASYSIPSVTRFGLINSLNVINVTAFGEIVTKFGFVPYLGLNELAGNEEKSDNKQVRWYEEHGRALAFVTANATVIGAPGAPITVTVGAGNYWLSGTLSMPSNNMIFRSAQTGVLSKVSNVNRTIPNAHTFQLTPINSANSASVTAGDELLSMGFLQVGPASDQTETQIPTVDRYSNYNTQLRWDTTLDDLAMMEKVEFACNGQHTWFTFQQQKDELRQYLLREYALMNSTQSNVGTEEGSDGILAQVAANGQTLNYSQFGTQTVMAQVDRLLSAVGAPGEYDVLAAKLPFQDMQNSITNEINNGAVIYAQGTPQATGFDIKKNFQSITMYNRTLNLTNYQLFDEQFMFGASGTGSQSNLSLWVPRGKTTGLGQDAKTQVTVPRMALTYQQMGGTNKWHMWETGAYASQPNTTVANKSYHNIAYFGVKVYGAVQYLTTFKQ
jgi:hypothetical protein